MSVTAELFFSVLRSIFRSLFLRSNNKASGNEPIPACDMKGPDKKGGANQYLCVIFRVLLNKTNVPEDVRFPGSSLENVAINLSWSPFASDFCSINSLLEPVGVPHRNHGNLWSGVMTVILHADFQTGGS